MMPNPPQALHGSPASLCPAPPPLVSVGPTQTPCCPTGVGSPEPGGAEPKVVAALAGRDGSEGPTVAPRPRRGRCVSSQASPCFLPPHGLPAHPPPQAPSRALGTLFWVSLSPPVLQCPRAEVGWLGGVVAPPAWQPSTHRWQSLGSRRGGICAFASAAHGGHREQDALHRGSGSARLPVALQPGGSGVPPRQHPVPLQGQLGCSGMQVDKVVALG